MEPKQRRKGSRLPRDRAGAAGNAVQGTVKGRSFSGVGSAYWIGKPGAGSPPTMLFVSEAALSCADVSAAGWDKVIGDQQLLEIALTAADPRAYAIGTDADANYLGGAYNPRRRCPRLAG